MPIMSGAQSGGAAVVCAGQLKGEEGSGQIVTRLPSPRQTPQTVGHFFAGFPKPNPNFGRAELSLEHKTF